VSHPASGDPPREHPDVESVETQYVIHTSLTTTLHYERGANAYDAFGKWARRHGLTGRVLAGQSSEEPFRHLEIALEADVTKGPELHEVHVVAERALQSSTTTRPEQ
jgi:hypothetical protein